MNEQETQQDQDASTAAPRQVISEQIGAGSILCQRYLLIQRLATGGTCDVYQARDLVTSEVSEDQSVVAIKILRPEIVDAVGNAGLVLNEALLTRQLDNPAIIKTYDYHCDRAGQIERHFVTMELVEGECLAELLARTQGRQLGLPQAMAIIGPVAKALSQAHSQGIVHSDIKPSNILVGQDGQVKLIDFGTARRINKLNGDPRFQVFTPEYASPEVLADALPSPQDDVYAFACVIYEMLAGVKPGAGNKDLSVEAAVIADSSDGARGTELTINGALGEVKPASLNFFQWRVLQKGMARSRVARYKTVDSFMRAFQRAKRLPIRLLFGVVLLPAACFGFAQLHNWYVDHQESVEVWAQSDLQLVQATHYADILMQTPVDALPQMLSDLGGLPALMRAGVLGITAEENLLRIENYVKERMAYNALALSTIGVRMESELRLPEQDILAESGFEGGLKGLSRSQAEHVDYDALLTKLDLLGTYYTDSARLAKLHAAVEAAGLAERDALGKQWERWWSDGFDPSEAPAVVGLHHRAVATAAELDLRLDPAAIQRFEQTLQASDWQWQAALQDVIQMFAPETDIYAELKDLWQKYQATARQDGVDASSSSGEPADETEGKMDSTQQAEIAKQLLFVAKVWRDVELLQAFSQVRGALSEVGVPLESALAKPVLSALVERIDLKISYYRNTDPRVSITRLATMRDQVSGYL
jgi:hypothetical protein